MHARTSSAASLGLSSRAEPSPFLVTLGTGQAMLTSIRASRSPRRSETLAAASRKSSGFDPNSCTAMSGSVSAGSTSSQVFSPP